VNREIECPGCGLILPADGDVLDPDFNASAACRDLMYEVTYYTLALSDPFFLHQLAVDTYAAQHAGPGVKPISTAFALAGLYLVFERGFTGRQVQRVHMEMARHKQEWPRFDPPEMKAAMTVKDVLGVPDAEKTDAIKEWGASVWETWKGEQDRIAALVKLIRTA
jgi:hypothetical protein